MNTGFEILAISAMIGLIPVAGTCAGKTESFDAARADHLRTIKSAWNKDRRTIESYARKDVLFVPSLLTLREGSLSTGVLIKNAQGHFVYRDLDPSRPGSLTHAEIDRQLSKPGARTTLVGSPTNVPARALREFTEVYYQMRRLRYTIEGVREAFLNSAMKGRPDRERTKALESLALRRTGAASLEAAAGDDTVALCANQQPCRPLSGARRFVAAPSESSKGELTIANLDARLLPPGIQ